MKYAITSFRGEVPRLTPRALPDNGAQIAENAQLYTGDLMPFKQFAPTIGLANGSTPIRTIYLLNDKWLSWGAEVDVARGAVAGDTTYRTYLTAPGYYDEPRFTDYALATTGTPPYPVATRPLGVPNPDTAPTLQVEIATVPDVDVTDEGDQLSSAWITSPPSLGTVFSQVTQDGSIGNPAPSYKIQDRSNVGAGAFAYRDFGIGPYVAMRFQSQFALTPSSFSGTVEASWRFACNESGSGVVVKVVGNGGAGLLIGVGSSWGDVASWLTQVSIPTTLDDTATTWYTMEIVATRGNSITGTVTARITDGSNVLAEAQITTNNLNGGFCGIEGVTSDPNGFTTMYDNFVAQGSGAISTALSIATSYVYTFVNDLGQESGPSPASATILRPDGVDVVVTTPGDVPSGISSDYGVTLKRIYRAATGNTGTVFRFVAEIPLAQTEYADELADSELGEVLISELWVLPPAGLQGILALPNGITAGFVNNQLCLSAQNYPHAWPVEYRLNTDTAIVGIGNVDNTVVIGTQSFVYIASGNDPAAYSMSKFEVPYACVSKRSFAYLTGIGVVFAGPDGLMAVAGPGQVRNLTDSVFTRAQWQALNPSSIFGVAHNDIYWMFWENGSERGCYGIDMKANGFGLIRMSFHASAVYTDPIEDKLYAVLDEFNEPDDALLPIPPDPPVHIDGATIFEFEGNPSVNMVYRYRGKLWLLPHPGWLTMFQVKAEDYDNILLRIYGDGVQIDELVVTGETEFTLAVADRYTRVEYEVLGTSRVRVLQGAEAVEELD